jgi:hypothetical protein
VSMDKLHGTALDQTQRRGYAFSELYGYNDVRELSSAQRGTVSSTGGGSANRTQLVSGKEPLMTPKAESPSSRPLTFIASGIKSANDLASALPGSLAEQWDIAPNKPWE